MGRYMGITDLLNGFLKRISHLLGLTGGVWFSKRTLINVHFRPKADSFLYGPKLTSPLESDTLQELLFNQVKALP